MAVPAWNPQAFLARLRVGVGRGVVKATEEVRKEAIRLILETAKTGRQYGKHRASAPGEPPASQTGTLVNRTVTDFDEIRLVGSVRFQTEYAMHLEVGTENMEARPYGRPALANKGDEITKIIVAEGRKEVGW